MVAVVHLIPLLLSVASTVMLCAHLDQSNTLPVGRAMTIAAKHMYVPPPTNSDDSRRKEGRKEGSDGIATVTDDHDEDDDKHAMMTSNVQSIDDDDGVDGIADDIEDDNRYCCDV